MLSLTLGWCAAPYEVVRRHGEVRGTYGGTRAFWADLEQSGAEVRSPGARGPDGQRRARYDTRLRARGEPVISSVADAAQCGCRDDNRGVPVDDSAQRSMKRSPVMADVAALAGVSHQTVSRALNNPSVVRPATRAKVEEAIEALGYRRNMSARALATRRSHLIGVVTPAVTLFGPSHMVMAIQEAARNVGYATISAGSETASESTAEILDFFLTLGVEGIIVIAPTRKTAEEALRLAERLPVVAIATGMPDPGSLHVVGIDNERGARDATRHLIELGHQRIAHISGPADWFEAQARMHGWRSELEAAGLPVPEPINGASWDAADGYTAAQALLAEGLPTAVFAANDDLALGAMRAFHEAGVAIPGEVAVVGFDDVASCAYYEPPLTTVRQPFEALGRQALEALMAALQGREPRTELTVPELLVRGSTAPQEARS